MGFFCIMALANIRLNRNYLLSVFPALAETVGDICYLTASGIREKPHDIIRYNAGTFIVACPIYRIVNACSR